MKNILKLRKSDYKFDYKNKILVHNHTKAWAIYSFKNGWKIKVPVVSEANGVLLYYCANNIKFNIIWE